MKLELHNSNMSSSSLIKMTKYKKKTSIVVAASGFRKYFEDKGIRFISSSTFSLDGLNSIQNIKDYKHFFIVSRSDYTRENIRNVLASINQDSKVIFFVNLFMIDDHKFLDEYFPERFI